jgi:hypothetical protein
MLCRLLCCPCQVPTKLYPFILLLLFNLFGFNPALFVGLATGYLCEYALRSRLLRLRQIALGA